MPQPHNFEIGANITVLDYHTSVAPFAWPTTYYVIGYDGDYFLAYPEKNEDFVKYGYGSGRNKKNKHHRKEIL